MSLPPAAPRPGLQRVGRYDLAAMSDDRRRPANQPVLPPGDLKELISTSGIGRVHVLAWRDLDDTESGGSELHAHEVLKRWSAAGLDVMLRTSAVPGLPSRVVRDGYQVVRSSGRYNVFPVSVIDELFHRHGRRDALVEIWNGVPFLTPIWGRGQRMVIQHHDHSAMWPLVLSPTPARLGSLLERRLAPPFYRSTPIVTLSSSSADGLVSGLGHRRSQVHVVEPGIDRRYEPLGTPEQPPLVLSVGRLMPSKRVDVLIRAFAEALRSVHGLRLEVIGEGPEEDSLRNLTTELDIAPAVSFRGRITDEALLDAYRRATVIASASISEGWGMTITEAAACATPSVVSDIAGHRDAVVHGQSGLLTSGQSDLAAGLVEVAGNGDRRAELSAGARSFAERFDWDRTATEAFRVLASTVKHR